jgi:hypothetical protein
MLEAIGTCLIGISTNIQLRVLVCISAGKPSTPQTSKLSVAQANYSHKIFPTNAGSNSTPATSA